MVLKIYTLLSRKYRSLLTFALLGGLFITFTSLTLAQGDVLNDPPKEYGLVQGWYQGNQALYYEFGTNTAATADGLSVIPAPIYVLVTGFDAEGNAQVVPDQRNIVDVIPGDADYSDLWQITFVTVPEDYEANSITAVDEVLSGGYELTVPGLLVNCPIVPAGSTLTEGGAPLVQGWYKGQEVNYFDFGLNIEATAPIYAFITGFDADGNPQFVEGQNNVIDVIPDDDGYSAFWSVNLVQVAADYQANSITSVAEILAGGYDITPAGILVNCPVLRTVEVEQTAEVAATEDVEPATDVELAADAEPAELPATGGDKSGFLLWIILIASGATLLGFGLFLRTKSVGNTELS